jgi:hypothetical protein
MKKVKDMVVTAFSKMDAINMLNDWRTFGKISENNYNKGRELISKTIWE